MAETHTDAGTSGCTNSIQYVAGIALVLATLPVPAQTVTRSQLEQQYRLTCSPQNIAAAPFLRVQCAQMRATIDQLAANGDLLEDKEPESLNPSQTQSVPSGVIGDPNTLSRERVYKDQCERKTPRTDAERAQCQRLYQMMNPGANAAPGASAPRDRGDPGVASRSRGTPVDEKGRPCVEVVDQKQERWGSNNENITYRYFFKNTCNHPMEAGGRFGQTNGTDQELSKLVCPGRTESLTCQSFSGRGCTGMNAWGFSVAQLSPENCERR